MSLKTSTGLRNQILDTGSLKTALNLGFINIYSGPVPATADAALSGNTLLCKISNNSTATGLTFNATAASAQLAKNSAEVWAGLVVAGGTGTFYRHVTAVDDGTLSTVQARIQGTINNVGAELNLTNPTLVLNATQSIDYYVVAAPSL